MGADRCGGVLYTSCSPRRHRKPFLRKYKTDAASMSLSLYVVSVFAFAAMLAFAL